MRFSPISTTVLSALSSVAAALPEVSSSPDTSSLAPTSTTNSTNGTPTQNLAAAMESFPKGCLEHRFMGGGEFLVARCMKFGWFSSKHCSMIDLKKCFAQEGGKIFPKLNGGLEHVQECVMDHYTGNGKCRAWLDGDRNKQAWIDISCETGIEENPKNGLLQCTGGGYVAPEITSMDECDKVMYGDDW